MREVEKVWVVIGEPYNEDVIHCAVFKRKKDADKYIEATTNQEPYLSIGAKELIVNETFKDLNHEST